MNPLENIRIVLVDPKTGGNIGSICRVMMNMGITDLAIVAPRDGLNWDDARKLAYHAEGLLEQRKNFDCLEDAIANCTVVAGTSARTGMHRDHAGLPRISQRACRGDPHGRRLVGQRQPQRLGRRNGIEPPEGLDRGAPYGGALVSKQPSDELGVLIAADAAEDGTYGQTHRHSHGRR